MCLHRTEHPSSCLCRLWEAWSKCLRAGLKAISFVSCQTTSYTSSPEMSANVNRPPVSCWVCKLRFNFPTSDVFTATWDFFYVLETLSLSNKSLGSLCALLCASIVFSHHQFTISSSRRHRENFESCVGKFRKKWDFYFTELQLLPRKVCWLAHKKCI